MKIKFLKPFRLYNPVGDDVMMGEGSVVDLEKEDYAEWLIDNGFAEKVDDEWPQAGDEYWTISSAAQPYRERWINHDADRGRKAIGNAFKTKEAAERYRDYLKAIATVRQDEGVLTPEEIRDFSWDQPMPYIGVCLDNELGVDQKNVEDEVVIASAIYFDTKEHAQASLDEHYDEWRTIANYDWSRE